MITPDQLAKSGSEHGIQAALFAWVAVAQYWGFDVANRWGEGTLKPPFNEALRNPVPALEWFHAVPNGGSRGDNAKSRAIRGGQMKAEGVRDGVADCFLPVAIYPHHGLYIEMKTPTGKIRPRQKEFRTFAVANGYAFSFERSWRDAAKLLQRYLENDGSSLELKGK